MEIQGQIEKLQKQASEIKVREFDNRAGNSVQNDSVWHHFERYTDWNGS